MMDLETMTDSSALDKSASAVEEAGYIHAFGMEPSGMVAFDLCQKLQRIGFHCGYMGDTRYQIIAF